MDHNLAIKALTKYFGVRGYPSDYYPKILKKAEEYVYMLAFDAKCNPLGVFELGHGSVNACILNPREIFQRALIYKTK